MAWFIQHLMSPGGKVSSALPATAQIQAADAVEDVKEEKCLGCRRTSNIHCYDCGDGGENNDWRFHDCLPVVCAQLLWVQIATLQ